MSSSNQHVSQVWDDLALPYTTNVNPATRTPQPYYVGGSNCLITSNFPVTRRPGFPAYNSTDHTPAAYKRFFSWRRWGGGVIVMSCVTNDAALTSKVYANFVLIHTCSTSSEPFDFVVSNNTLYFANGVDRKKYDGVMVTNWGAPPPAAAPGITNSGVGNVPGVLGHRYVFWYGDSVTGYASDVSPASAFTNAAARTWTIDGARSTDSGIDQVHIARTEDGGGVLYELSNSPIANPAAGNWSIADNDFDLTQIGTPQLQSRQAPLRGVNGVPPAIKGMKYWNGRIWGVLNDEVAFSGLEEVNNGVPEDSWGSALTNRRPFGDETIGVEVLGDSTSSVLLVFTPTAIHYISGSSLATFRTDTLSWTRGVRNRACIAAGETEALGPFVVWLDISNTIRLVTLNGGIRYISAAIAPDIENIDHSQASLTIHEDGGWNWLVLCDGGAEKLRVLDLDTMRWMVPWPITNITVISSIELSGGIHKLFLGRGKALAMDHTIFRDDGIPYQATLNLNITSVLDPDRPEQIAFVEYIGVERDSRDIEDLGYLLDEDPLTGTPTYTSIISNETDPFLRATVDNPFLTTHISGVNLIEKWYYLRDKAGCRRAGIKITWPAEDADFKLFTMAMISSRFGDS